RRGNARRHRGRIGCGRLRRGRRREILGQLRERRRGRGAVDVLDATLELLQRDLILGERRRETRDRRFAIRLEWRDLVRHRYARRAAKNDASIMPHSRSSTPAVTSGRWLSLG